MYLGSRSLPTLSVPDWTLSQHGAPIYGNWAESSSNQHLCSVMERRLNLCKQIDSRSLLALEVPSAGPHFLLGILFMTDK